MKSDILVCADPEGRHDRPVYTLSATCPECGADAINSSPAPYSPDDSHGRYRRRVRARATDEE